jgi:hypothetical protein
MRKRLFITAALFITVMNAMGQDDMYYNRTAGNRNYMRTHSRYLNDKLRNASYNQQPSVSKVIHTVDTIYIQDASVAELKNRLSELESQLKKHPEPNNVILDNNMTSLAVNEPYAKWMSKYSSGDCLKKSGYCQYKALGTIIFGTGITYALAYTSANNNESSEEFKCAAYCTGIATGVVSFIFYLNSVKWKIRAGKKSNIELQMKGSGLALNF